LQVKTFSIRDLGAGQFNGWIDVGAMNTITMWIRDGSLTQRPCKPNGDDYQDKVLFDQFAMVRIATDRKGTTVQWNMACPNWASLMMAARLVCASPGPVRLCYFNVGWFTEIEAEPSQAADRIDSLIYKSDVRLSDRAYTTVVVPDLQAMPHVLRDALTTGTSADEDAVICAVETEREASHVEHIGKQSLIGRIWGVSPNTYPCLNGHSYDRAVTPEYFKVVESGKPHYDHVLASMVRPDGELHWMGYHRVILPDLRAGRRRVRVVSELAPVQIRLL
jgi:hypothetical protein